MTERQTAIIVGVGPGLGLAIARRFARGGLRVALVARSEEKLRQYERQMTGEGPEARGFVGDASSPASLAAAFRAVRESLGAPSVCVYNAVGVHPGPASGLTPEDLADDLNLSVVGALATAREALPAMRERGEGTLLFTGGGAAFMALRDMATLSITKAAMRNLALCLAAESEGTGVHVATVTVSGMVAAGTHFDPDLIAEEYWKLHTQTGADRQTEIVYRGEGTRS